ncbi:MAG: S8 family serine peptidase [Pseudomonadota bacterium]
MHLSRRAVAAVALGAVALTAALVASPASDGGRKASVAPRLRTLAPGRRVPVLVVLRPAAASSSPRRLARAGGAVALVDGLRRQARVAQAPLIARLRRLGVPFRSYWLANVVALRADRSLVQALARRDDVSAVVPDAAVRERLEPVRRTAARRTAIEWGVEKIGAPVVWARGVEGQEIVVGVPDSGFEWEHPALRAQYRGTGADGAVVHDYNWHDAVHADIDGNGANPCGFSTRAPCDDDGHGTFAAGLAVGRDGGEEIGVAPRARLVGCRTMDNGVGRPSTYLECLQFFLAPTDLTGSNPDPSRRVDVVSNSWVCPPDEGCDALVLQPAVDAMRAAGIFMAAAAGNDGPACASIRYPPPIYDGVFTVGNAQADDTIRASSSRGPVTVDGSGRPKPDVVAPGTNVMSARPGGTYGTGSGTSFASPHVAGAVALLWSAFPSLRHDVDRTERLLRESAVPIRTTDGCGGDALTQVPNETYGSGRIQVEAAYERAAAEAPDTTAPVVSGLVVSATGKGVRRVVALRFRLSEAARVTARLERRAGSRWVAAGAPVVADRAAGAAAVRAVRALRPGSYRATAQPRDRAGNVGATVRAGFRVRA